MDKKRIFGLLVPVSSLPSDEGIGTFGEHAYRFIDFLEAAGASVWQVLPLVPTNYGDSPYQSCSSSALSPYFIDLKLLVRDGLLTEREIRNADLIAQERRVDYGKQFRNKTALLRCAFSRFDTEGKDFSAFVQEEKYRDFAVFMALKCKFGHRAWSDWDEPYRSYDQKIIDTFAVENRREVLFWQFTQFVFLRQWNALKDYAHQRGVRIMGDIPLYLAYDSVEMWKYGDALFRVDSLRRPSFVAGVPPDAFTDDGQLWGNPLYDWEKMKQDGYRWWNERLSDGLALFDILRIDHFRGFDRYYAVPVGEPNARNGTWEKGPGEELFADKLDWNIVAEDLGVIDDGVIRMMKNLGYPGMKVLEFAFDGWEGNEHKPSCYTENFVCYTGTHDNMPLCQHIEDLAGEWKEKYIRDVQTQCELLGVRADLTFPREICHSIIRLAFASKAFAAIIPLWDLLAMGGEARINLPATVSPDNWSFRFTDRDFSEKLSAKLNFLAGMSGRTHK